MRSTTMPPCCGQPPACISLASYWVGEIIVPSNSRFDPSSHLAFGDVCIDNVVTLHYLEVRIKASKTDPFWQGVSKFLGATGRDACPVASILSYMVFRGHDSGSFLRFPMELALLGTDLSLQCGQLWTVLDTTLLFTRAIASVSVKLPPWLSVGYWTL